MKILITGASSGIGAALSRHLAAAGHEVWGWARRAEKISGLATPVDVSDWGQVQAAARHVAAKWDSCDAVICAAGIQGAVGPAMACDPHAWAQTVEVNLNGTYFTLRGLYPLLKRSSVRAKAVCFSGGGATAPRENFSAYGAAKTGVVRLVETLSREWKALPIDINSVAPGALSTAMTDEVLRLGPQVVGEADYQAAIKTRSQGQAGFEKLFGLVDFLLSSRSDGLSGKLLSAPWDPWATMETEIPALMDSELYTLRRVTELKKKI